jgi:hypothetical protein
MLQKASSLKNIFEIWHEVYIFKIFIGDNTSFVHWRCGTWHGVPLQWSCFCISVHHLSDTHCINVCDRLICEIRTQTCRLCTWTFLYGMTACVHLLLCDAAEGHALVFNIFASYSGAPGFKTLFGYRLSWLQFLCFFSVPPGKFRDIAVNYAATAPFQTLNSIFTVIFSGCV